MRLPIGRLAFDTMALCRYVTLIDATAANGHLAMNEALRSEDWPPGQWRRIEWEGNVGYILIAAGGGGRFCRDAPPEVGEEKIPVIRIEPGRSPTSWHFEQLGQLLELLAAGRRVQLAGSDEHIDFVAGNNGPATLNTLRGLLANALATTAANYSGELMSAAAGQLRKELVSLPGHDKLRSALAQVANDIANLRMIFRANGVVSSWFSNLSRCLHGRRRLLP